MVSGSLCAEQVVDPNEYFIVLRWCLQDTVESWQYHKCAKEDKVVSAEFFCTMKDNRWIHFFFIRHLLFVAVLLIIWLFCLVHNLGKEAVTNKGVFNLAKPSCLAGHRGF